MKQSFEDFLMDKCPSHTNNGPEGFEKWAEELDGSEYEEYAQEYGEKCFLEGREYTFEKLQPIINKLKEDFNLE